MEGAADNFVKPAYFNIYRNLEHMYRGRGDEAKADEIVQIRMSKLGVFEDVTLEEQPEQEEADDDDHNRASDERATHKHQ